MLKLCDRLSIFNYDGEVVIGNYGYYVNFNQKDYPHAYVCSKIARKINPIASCFAHVLEDDYTYDNLYITKTKHCFFPEFDSLEKLEKFINIITGKKQKDIEISIF